MSHLFGVTTHGYDRPIAAASCPRILSEYHARNDEPDKYAACDLGRTAAVFPDRDLRQADVLYGSSDGYSYGSNKRASLMRRRSLPPAETPRDTYRLPPLTNMRYHWFFGDPALAPRSGEKATRNPLGQCEVAERSYPPPRLAGLTSSEIDMVIRLQERGLIRKASGGVGPQGPPGLVIPQGTGRSGAGSTKKSTERSTEKSAEKSTEKSTEGLTERSGVGSAGSNKRSEELSSWASKEQTPVQRAPPEPEAASGEEKQTVGLPTGPREVCEKRTTPHLWYEHRYRHPQFYSAMTRFVETVRINDKLFEMY